MANAVVMVQATPRQWLSLTPGAEWPLFRREVTEKPGVLESGCLSIVCATCYLLRKEGLLAVTAQPLHYLVINRRAFHSTMHSTLD